MTFALQLSSAAESDLEQARTWYGHSSPELAGDFVHSVEDALARILNHPEAYPLIQGPYRRALVRRFSFAMFFRIDKNMITISAILHTSRAPFVWQKRLTH